MANQIHPTAVIDPSAELGEDVLVGPYVVINAHVHVGDRTKIGPQVVLGAFTSIGEDNSIHGQASLGGDPQDFTYGGEDTRLVIGDRNTIREFVTINRGTVKGGGVTKVGSDCLLMACSHIAHDCDIGDGVILANNVLLAGHVKVGRRANISGSAAAHHFVTIGEFAYVGGLSRMVQDVPPYVILEGHPSRVRDLNKIGLRRGGLSEEEIAMLKDVFRLVFRTDKPRIQVCAELRDGPLIQSQHVAHLVESLENADKGHKGRYRELLRDEFARAGAELLGITGA
jgi:UDP-N-acetylglucosamine acyltransferase